MNEYAAEGAVGTVVPDGGVQPVPVSAQRVQQTEQARQEVWNEGAKAENDKAPWERNGQADDNELTIKFAKGLAEPFTSKDGKEYAEILIPNIDPNDKAPWASFVLPAKNVHENKFGKGLWAKIPEDGTTTLRRSVPIGVDEAGKKLCTDQSRKVTNTELKKMVEAYKERPRDSVRDRLADDRIKPAVPAAGMTAKAVSNEIPFR